MHRGRSHLLCSRFGALGPHVPGRAAAAVVFWQQVIDLPGVPPRETPPAGSSHLATIAVDCMVDGRLA